jgi:hypothetical protein|tara:strand:- start:143 stop:556 length:414 start_codon:yes stop_codon:yes gene_type:complete
MKDKFAKIDEVFDSDSNIVKEASAIKKEIVDIKTSETDVRRDYEYTRGNLYSLIEKGQEAINGIMELAQESEMPRAYEVAGQLIKNVADATDKLLELQKKLKEVEEESASKGPTNVTNALFVGSTAELSKLLKKQEE